MMVTDLNAAVVCAARIQRIDRDLSTLAGVYRMTLSWGEVSAVCVGQNIAFERIQTLVREELEAQKNGLEKQLMDMGVRVGPPSADLASTAKDLQPA